MAALAVFLCLRRVGGGEEGAGRGESDEGGWCEWQWQGAHTLL